MVDKVLEQEAEAKNKIGDQLFKRKQYKEAMEAYLESVSMMQQAGNTKRVENFKEELRKAAERYAEEVNKKGDEALKKKNYQEAVGLYMESVQIMEKTGNDKKAANFRAELNTALKNRAYELFEEAKRIAREDKMEEALDKIQRARTNAKQTQDPKFMDEMEKNADVIYEIVADIANEKGDKAYKQGNYADAITFYKKSVELIKKTENKKKLENFSKELAKAFSEHAQEINDAGDKAFKSGNYEQAIEIYQESVNAANASGNTKLAANFEKELQKSFELLAKQVNSEGDKLFKAKKYEEAGKLYLKSVQLAQGSKIEKLVKEFTAELRKTYEAWAAELKGQADDLFKNKNYEAAIEKYKEAVKIAETTGDDKKINMYQRELLAGYKNWALNINVQGDSAFKMGDFEKAYEFYEKSVQLAELSQDEKSIKDFRKERDKALKKVQA